MIFAGAERPFSFGRFYQAESHELGDGTRSVTPKNGGQWHMHLELPGEYQIGDGRDWLTPGAWTVRLIIGADDGDARTYDVEVSWDATPPRPRTMS